MVPAENTFYVTTPIYYVNAQPHIGHLYTTVLADVAARWNKIQGKEVFFLTGTDEHGQKIEQAAQAAGKTPQEFVDSIVPAFQQMWKNYDIEYSKFIRTTDPDHIRSVQAWIKQLQAKGDIYKATYKGYYCTPDEMFVTEKDQTTLDASGVPLCPSCGRPTKYLEEESYFFKLSAYQDRLLKFYEEHPEFVTPSERLHEAIAFVKSGLRDLSISRSNLKWGIPFPGDEKHVCYVWADALNNYISAIGYADPKRAQEFAKWWPADLQIMGKEIVRFHVVYWPAFLMAVDLDLPKKLLVHGWILMGDRKMSKSLGNVIDPQQLQASYGIDAVRYYFVRHLAVTQDSPFNIPEFEQRINADLVHDLSNLVHRTLTLASNNGISKLSAGTWSSAELELFALCKTTLQECASDMQEGLFYRAYSSWWKVISAVNAYFHAQEPWKVVKTDPARFAIIISATAQCLYAIGIVLWPVMPRKMEQLFGALGVAVTPHVGTNYIKTLLENPWEQTFTLTPIAPLFMTIKTEEHKESLQGASASDKKVLETKKMESTGEALTITIDDFVRVQLLVGTITAVDLVPKSEKLYRLTVDLGTHGVRQICSGVRAYFTPEDLLGKQGVFVANLQPRQMMGLASHGMMLTAADAEGKVRMVTVGSPVPNGTQLR